MSELPGPWYGAVEATIFTGWVYDFLKPHAVELKVAHPAMLKAITSAKKKNDRADAEKIADLLRVNRKAEGTLASYVTHYAKNWLPTQRKNMAIGLDNLSIDITL